MCWQPVHVYYMTSAARLELFRTALHHQLPIAPLRAQTVCLVPR